MPDRLSILIAVAVLLSIGQYVMRRSKARQVAHEWLRQHSYHPLRLTIPWFFTRAYRFAPAPLRNNDKAFYLRAEVEDRKLGGVGVVWIRTWIGWMGDEIGDTEVFWEHMPVATDGMPAGPAWESTQLALLDRVASGEHTFRPTHTRSEEAGAAFDLDVEHILALQRRGLVTCATPVAEVRIPGRQYAFISDVRLTEEGQRVVGIGRAKSS